MSSATSIDKLNAVLPIVAEAYSDFAEPPKITIENFAGFVRVPVGLAGPLKIQGSENTNAEFIAPLATVEPTLVSRYARLQTLTPHVIGSNVHLKFDYFCGDAAGQNMVTIATQVACDRFLATDAARDLGVEDFVIEGELASHKKASWGNEPRGVQVVAWGELSNSECEEVLRCSTERLYTVFMWAKEGQTRNGQLGSNINTANIVAAMFIACGQDAGSVAEASWSHLTAELDWATKKLKLSLFFPSLPVGVKASLELLRCQGPGTKRRLAGLVACFALALDISTLAAIASGHFAQSHERLARGKVEESSKL
ncbi:substrate-binding domain of hmg-CoA reductase [Lizonia empirigonia]|nr:substrate-binding domain of hmg-CoA reductase [Lizonia empirigonia]KAF1354304.1 substrate-binding domain of hmg-CoA reductase [Lizonia empirigonia]